MGNACTNCTACDGEGHGEILTVDHKVSSSNYSFILIYFFYIDGCYETKLRVNCKYQFCYQNLKFSFSIILLVFHNFSFSMLFRITLRNMLT